MVFSVNSTNTEGKLYGSTKATDMLLKSLLDAKNTHEMNKKKRAQIIEQKYIAGQNRQLKSAAIATFSEVKTGANNRLKKRKLENKNIPSHDMNTYQNLPKKIRVSQTQTLGTITKLTRNTLGASFG